MKVLARVGVFVLGGFLAVSLRGQNWPVPAATPNTPVKCGSDCPGALAGKPTPGWSDPIVGFTGRFVDSAYTQDFQQTFRTARAGGVRTSPDGTRIYVTLGNAVAAYDAERFFQRLESHEALVSATSAPVSPRNTGTHAGSPYENYLNFDQFFYAEHTSSGWNTPPADGQDRLYNFDVDDRGVLYLAYSMFGWGTAKDAGEIGSTDLMVPTYQDPASLDFSPRRVFWVKSSSGSYYAFVGRPSSPTFVYNVDDYLHPVSRGSVQAGYTDFARGNGRIAVINESGALLIYDNDTLISGGKPITTAAVSLLTGAYAAVVYDGTNFWAAGYAGLAYSGVLSKFAPDGSGGYTRTDFSLSGPNEQFQVQTMRYRNGFLGIGSFTWVGMDVRLIDISSGTPVDYPLNGQFFHYYTSPPTGYIRAPRAIPSMIQPWVRNGKLYAILPAGGLGDVWQLRGNGSTQPPPSCGTLVAGTNVSATFRGPSSSCSNTGGTCLTTESIAFNVAFSGGYDTSCATHAYTWQFDDGSQMSGASVSKVLTAGTHDVSCAIWNGSQTVTVSTKVTVEAPPPPQVSTCGTMAVNGNVFGTYKGPASGCKDTGGTCVAGESIAFSIFYWQFTPTCTTTYTWQFDDGGTASGQAVTHSFSTGGTHTATCTVTNSSQSLPVPFTVTVNGSSAMPAPSVSLEYAFLGSGKYQFTPTIVSGTVTSFAWDFGDGSTMTTTNASPVQHTYSSGGATMMTLQAGNTTASTLIAKTIRVDLSAILHGDANNDGVVGASDVFYFLNYFFNGGPAPAGTPDVNGDGVVSSADVFYLINYVFSGGPAPR